VQKDFNYHTDIPSDVEFSKHRQDWRESLGNNKSLRDQAISLTVAANEFMYGYQWEWCGVPIIRHPDDMVLQQEIIWNLRPTHIVETGIARGGSLILSASLMEMTGVKANVLGIDIQIFPHAQDALRNWINENKIHVHESDSTSASTAQLVKDFLSNSSSPALIVLDSNHSHNHVLNELVNFSALVPVESIIMVADTIISEMPDGSYENRPWSNKSNPLTAVEEFLRGNQNFKLDKRWSRRSLMGECRDGIIRRIR
jgi:cephalosporin hydroxylase